MVLCTDSSPAAPSGAIDEDHGTGLEAHAGLVTGRALHDFDGQDDQELSFKVIIPYKDYFRYTVCVSLILIVFT